MDTKIIKFDDTEVEDKNFINIKLYFCKRYRS